MAQLQPQLDYAANVEKYASTVDAAAVKGIVKYLGIALQNRDSSLVAASDPEELRRVRNSFMKEKLGLTQTDAEFDAALIEVMTTMSGERNAADQAGAVSIKHSVSGDIFGRIQQTYDTIGRRAFEIFENNGRQLGNELRDWLRAESGLL
jgi:hypothetical protein